MSLTVPFRVPRQPRPDGDGTTPDAPPGHVLAVGRLELRSAVAYLLLWTVVVFVVEVLVLWSSHTALHRLGVLESVSRAAATVLDQPLSDSGLLPALELDALLPWLVVAAAALAVLWLLTLLALVLVHNGVCALTGGPRVHLR